MVCFAMIENNDNKQIYLQLEERRIAQRTKVIAEPKYLLPCLTRHAIANCGVAG